MAMKYGEPETQMKLTAARNAMDTAIDAVVEASIDYHEVETDKEQGSWARSQVYAVLKHKLYEYEKTAKVYRALLHESIQEHETTT